MTSHHRRRVGMALAIAAVLSTSACFSSVTDTPPRPAPAPIVTDTPPEATPAPVPVESKVDEGPGEIVEEPQDETFIKAPPVFSPSARQLEKVRQPEKMRQRKRVLQPRKPNAAPFPTQPPAAPITPAAPVLTLRADTGSSSVDGITNNPTIDVGGLVPSGSWERWNGTAWVAGSGTSFDLDEGTFALGAVTARQTVRGVTSAAGVLAHAVTVDLTPPDPAAFALANDTGAAGDWTSADGTVMITVSDPEPWQLRTSSADPWEAPAASVLLPVGTTPGLAVRQVDVAGNERVTAAPAITVVTSLAGEDPVLTPVLLETLLQRNTGFTISGDVPISLGDVVLENLDGMASSGITGKLSVSTAGIAGADLTQLADVLTGSLVVIDTTSGPATIDLSGWAHGVEVRGNAWDSTLIGGAGNDRLVGGNGNDTLIGGEGDDELYSSNGINRLQGGPGADFLSLGGTSNTVVITFADADGQTMDRVTGFISGLDKFEIEHPLLPSGPLGAGSFHTDSDSSFTGSPVGGATFVLSHWNGTAFASNRVLWACYQATAPCTALVDLGTASFVTAGDITVIEP